MAGTKKETTTTYMPKASVLAFSEGALSIVESVVKRTHLSDPSKLLPEVCDELVRLYPGSILEYRTHQMNMRTTNDVTRIIEYYFISKRLFPDREYTKIPAADFSPID